MTDAVPSGSPRLFPPGYRAAGVLLHVTSLPSRYGIGDVGPAALAWIDRLHAAGQRWWQALPLGPTGSGDSPYQPLSTFAGNGLLISPDWIIEDGLLTPHDCAGGPPNGSAVDYRAVIAFKHGLLPLLHARFIACADAGLRGEFEQFCTEQAHWLDDYALFRALKAAHGDVHYLNWPRELIDREPAALARARHACADVIDAVRLVQFLLSRQIKRMVDYAHGRGIRVIGDLPFFVAPDSSEVWANPGLFLLDQRRRPTHVAGVPPDYFSATGQRWGNPVYDWPAHRKSGFRWWIDRVRALLSTVDVVRLDHFRGFAAAWHIPAEAATAQTGAWVPAPGGELFDALRRELGSLPLIVEDLGHITPDVTALRDRFGLPGTRVLQFAFDGDPNNPFLPHRCPHNAVVYTATHDNNTSRGWYQTLPPPQRAHFWNYLRHPRGHESQVAGEMLRLAMSSKAALAIAPLQDILNLGAEARMNTPGRTDANWQWRCTADILDPAAFDRLGMLTAEAARCGSSLRP